MVTKSYINSITPGPAPVVLHASQYDKLSRTYVFTLTSGGEPFEIPEGALVTVQGTKPDKTGFQYSCTYSGPEVTFRIEEQMTVLAGEIPCELVITEATASGTAILGTSNFLLIVEEAALADDTVISETDLPLIQEALQVAPEVVAAASSAAAARDQAVAAATAAGTSETNAAASASTASTAAQTATTAVTQIGTSVEQAAASASAAAQSATAAASSAAVAGDAEAWAVGQRDGVDVPSTDETYHNNSKYYAEESATGGAAALAALSGLTFAQNTDGEWGYKVGGADPVIPFKSLSFTRLWTNPTPTAKVAAGYEAALEETAKNFDYLRIVWARTNALGITADNWEEQLFSLSVMYDMRNPELLTNYTNQNQMGAFVRPGAGFYTRRCYFTTTACTEVAFGDCLRTSQSQTNNALLIPILIDGVKT